MRLFGLLVLLFALLLLLVLLWQFFGLRLVLTSSLLCRGFLVDCRFEFVDLSEEVAADGFEVHLVITAAAELFLHFFDILLFPVVLFFEIAEQGFGLVEHAFEQL